MLTESLAAASYPIPTRDELITLGLPIVRRLAFRMVRRLPPSVDVGDLIGAGHEGLLKAADAYDATRYPRFEPYAEARIRGAILDELRASDQMTRHGRRRLAQVSRTIRELNQKLGRSPSEEEIAARLEMPLDQYRKLAEHLARGPALARLGEIEADDVADKGRPDPASTYAQKEMKQRIAEAIKKLPERTQMVLALYYQEECTQAEIGRVLGVTEGRVCQILGEATARLRARLGVSDRDTRRRNRGRGEATRSAR